MKNILNKSLYQTNKIFANQFRDSMGFKEMYDINLLNLINSMFLITKPFTKLAFVGPNPQLFLEKIPPGLFSLFLSDPNRNFYIL